MGRAKKNAFFARFLAKPINPVARVRRWVSAKARKKGRAFTSTHPTSLPSRWHAADGSRDPPGVAFLAVANLVRDQGQHRVDLHVARFAGRGHDAQRIAMDSCGG